MSDEDPVLAELDRRIALAEAATKGPWFFDIGNGEVEQSDTRISICIRADVVERDEWAAKLELPMQVHPDDELEFIADAGTHRLNELRALKTLYAICKENNAWVLGKVIASAILAEDGER